MKTSVGFSHSPWLAKGLKGAFFHNWLIGLLLIGWLIDWLIDWFIDLVADYSLINYLLVTCGCLVAELGLLTIRLIWSDWMINRLIDWLIDWFIDLLANYSLINYLLLVVV